VCIGECLRGGNPYRFGVEMGMLEFNREISHVLDFSFISHKWRSRVSLYVLHLFLFFVLINGSNV